MRGYRRERHGAKKFIPEDAPIAEERTQVDAVIVLGAAVWNGGRASPALRRRVLHGVDLLRRGRSNVMLVTGGRGKYPPSEAEVMKQIAVAEGIAPERIIVEDKARSTFESVLFCTSILRERQWSSAVVVSDPYHLLRTVLVFRAFGIRATGSAAKGGRQGNTWYKWLYYYIREMIALGWYLILTAREKVRRSEKRDSHTSS